MSERSMLHPSADFDYHPRVRELFANLDHAGNHADLFAPASAVHGSQAGSVEQGFSIHLWIELQAGRINKIRYQAYGCPHFLAACEASAHWIEGRRTDELKNWSWRDIESELAIPAGKRARLLVLAEAVQRLALY